MILIVFEDEGYSRLLPLTYTRPIYGLRLGVGTLLEKILGWWGGRGPVKLHAREYLMEVLRERYPGLHEEPGRDEDALLVNGSVVMDGRAVKVAERLVSSGEARAVMAGGRVAMAYLTRGMLDEVGLPPRLPGPGLRVEEEALTMLGHIWEIPRLNRILLNQEMRGIVGDRGVRVEEDSEVEEGVILDTREGPIYIGHRCRVEAPTRISGPAYIGDGTMVLSGLIRPGCSIGPVCRVGGEVEETVFQGYSNKRHYGYLGHTYVGEWVNLGAGTTVSNLKNTYGGYRMVEDGRVVETGRMFLGAFIADHVKTGIGTLIYGGRRVGVASHIQGLVTEDVPSFTYLHGQERVELGITQVIKTAKRMMERRGRTLTQAEERLLRHLHSITREERERRGVKRGRIGANKS